MTLHGPPEAIHDARLSARACGGSAINGELSYWEPGSQRAFAFELDPPHELAGDYRLLLEVAFRDKSSANLGAAISFPSVSARPRLTAALRQDEWLGLTALLALSAWPVTHANPALWLTHTRSAGGDVASQVFYAKVFQ